MAEKKRGRPKATSLKKGYNLMNYDKIVAQSDKLVQLPSNDLGQRFYQDENDVMYPSITTVCAQIKDREDKTVPSNVLIRLGEIGTRLHESFADHFRGNTPSLSPDLLPAWKQFQGFVDRHKMSPFLVERKVVSKTMGVAGTLDWAGEFTSCDGPCCKTKMVKEPCIVDWKTGSYSIKTGWQLAGYRRALVEMGDDTPRRMIGIQIHRSGSEPRVFAYTHNDWCLEMLAASIQAFKGIHFTELAKMKWPYLHKSAFNELGE